MPIIQLQRRLRQLGEIRIGHVVPTGKPRRDGKPGTRPAKLKAFRFTSASPEILASVAALYGGEVQPWTPANGGPAEFEVYSTATRLPVLIPPQNAVSQWYEMYAGSKCVRRCDGEIEQKSDKACLCNPEKRDCKITTRVNVMLRDVPALGQWLLITKGYYAATELPPAAELLAQVGGYVDGWLGMEEKRVVTDDGPTVFMIPTLDVEITPAALMAGKVTGGTPAVVASSERVAITGGRPDYAALAAAAKTPEDIKKLWTQANQAKHLDDALAAVFKARAAELGAPVKAPPPDDVGDAAGGNGGGNPPSTDDPVDAEIVDDADLGEIWFQIMAAAGTRGWTTDDTETKFAQRNGGLMPGTATAAQLREFLIAVKGGEVA